VIDRVSRGTQPPVTPHDPVLHEFVQEVKALYDLADADELRLLDTVGSFVNIVAVNALAARPRVAEPEVLVAQGVQDGPEFMRPKEVSHALGIPQSTLSNMRVRNEGPLFRKEGKRTVLYRRGDVRAYAEGKVPVMGTAPVKVDSLGPVDGKTDPSELRDA